MTNRRKVEVFSAGCPLCEDAASLVEEVAGAAHDVQLRDLHEDTVARRARALGIRSVPAVVIDGELADCCAGGGISERALQRSLEKPFEEEAAGGAPEAGSRFQQAGARQEEAVDETPRRRRGCC